MTVTIGVETALQDEVRDLIAALDAHLRPLSPREFQFQMTVEQMDDPATTVFVAREDGGRALGCGALRIEDETLGEVKRMYTLPQVRGLRVGVALLEAIVSRAREVGLTRLVPETGATPGFEPAWRLYERGGFIPCGAVLDYPDSGYSKFFERAL